MKVTLSAKGVSEPVKVNVHQNDFKVTLIGVSKGFTGKWGVEYSPDGESWLPHEDMYNLAVDTTGNLFFNVPQIRLRVLEHSAGEMELHVIQGA